MSAVALVPSNVQAQAIEAWVQRYNGPANGNDYLRAMVVATNGDVYVTGYSLPPEEYPGSWATVKLSSKGVPAWTNLYSGPGGSGATASALAVDAGGNAYVTGQTIQLGYCTTIKYSGAGVPLWTNLFTQPNGGGNAVALDTNGDVFVVANLHNGADYDIWTIKYSGAGTPLWTKSYRGLGNSYDFANAMAVDFTGNVVVTGESETHYVTIKYSSVGLPLWTNWYSGPSANNRARAVTLDAGGNVFVTGESVGSRNNFDYATVAYSSAGVPMWTNRYEGPENSDDNACAIAVGASGDAVVTGYNGWGDYITIKYSSAGVPLWTNRCTGAWGRPPTIAVDATGNVYVTGGSAAGDYLTIGYSASGTLLWTNVYNGPGNGTDIARPVVVDASRNVFVAGNSTGVTTAYDFAVVKYVVPPIITRQPFSQANAVGTTATFSVEVAGGLPFSYQWRREGTNLVDGGNISGLTTTNLQIANVQLADAVGYSVVVTNAYGSVTSVVAQLTVTIPPNPGRFGNLSYSPTMGFSFIFRDATVGQPYRIQRSPSAAPGTWVDWQSFTYSEPILFTDMGATGTERRLYRAVSP